MRVLFLTHRLPYAPNRGDRIRAYHILRTLRGRADVTLVSLAHDEDEEAKTGELNGLVDAVAVARVRPLRNRIRGAAALLTRRPLTHVFLDSPDMRPLLTRLTETTPFDVVLAYCSGMARFALEPPLDRLPLVVDLVDVDSCKWSALAETTRPPLQWVYRREAHRLAIFERRAARAAFATTVINQREADALTQIVPDARVDVVTSGVDFSHLRPPSAPAASSDVVFCGVMNYAPNEQGAAWLARDVWPLVRASVPHARLRLVGSNPTAGVRALASADPSVEVTGEVPDVRPYLWSAAVAAAPLHTARGLQNKVLEAIAAGLPVIVSSVVADGLPATVLPACRVAESAPAFAAAIVESLRATPESRRAIVDRIDLTPLSWERRLAPLPDLLEAAVRAGRRIS
jgi:polysaccharide biosynthesis protein PslH